jgi:chromosome segregation ATPase
MRQQKELENQVQSKKEQIDDLERVRIEKDQKIVTLESELLKEKEKIHAI